MSTTDLAQQVADLTTATTQLTQEVVGQKDRLTTAADTATGKATDASGSAQAAATSEANAYTSKVAAKASEDAAKQITGLDTVEQAVDMALGEFAGMMTESEARALQAQNQGYYAASGMVHTGKQYPDGGSFKSVNEGMWTHATTPSVLQIGRAASQSGVGTSKTDFGVMHIAGAVANLTGKVDTTDLSALQFQLPQAEDGTRIYDSTGDARGSGKASLDLKVDVDPRHGDVAPDLATAVNRAFCELSGETPDGLGGTYDTATHVIVSGTGSKGASWNPYYGSKEDISKTYSYEIVLKSIDATRMRVQASASTTSTAELLHDEPVIAGEQKVFKGTFQPDQTTTPTPLAGLHISSYSGESLELVSLQFKVATEEVVTHPVDLVGLEYYEEELTGRQEVFECIQSLGTTFGTTGVPTVLSTRKLSYFQQYDGQFPEVTANPDFINDRYRCVVWDELSETNKRKIAAYMKERLFMGVNKKPVNGRLRARTIRGLGNGDWGSIDSSLPNHYLDWSRSTPVTHIRPQGSKDVVGVMGSGFPLYSARRDGTVEHPDVKSTKGVFGAMGSTSAADSASAYQGRCFMYVVATVPRANKGAYHPDLNPWGCRQFIRSGGGSGAVWYGDLQKEPSTTADCFDVTAVSNPNGVVAVGTGFIGSVGSGHPDGLFYDGIEAGGLNGVIDWRLGAVANDSPEEAAKVEAKVENGTYRGLEKLVWTQAEGYDFDAPSGTLYRISSGGTSLFIAYSSAKIQELSDRLSIGDKVRLHDTENNVYLTAEITGFDIGGASLNTTNIRAYNDYVIASSTVYSATNLTKVSVLTEKETNLSVSGEFNTQMVIGDPANILLTDALKDGWLGTWCPVIPAGASVEVPFTREVVREGSRTYTRDNGNTWTYFDSFGVWDPVRNSRKYTPTANQVEVFSHKAFAKQTKQTKPSNNKPVYNGKAGLLGVTVTQSYDKSVLAEAVAGIILKSDASGIVTEQSNPVKFLVNEVIERITSLATDMVAPTNSSQAIKIAVYQISENGQVSLGFITNTMTHNGTDWGELDEIIIPFGNLEVDTFNDANGIPQTAQSTMTAIPHGWTSNHARAGEQVPGVDL